MKSIKRIICLLIIFVLISITKIYAANFNISSSITEKKLYPGEEFDTFLRLENISSQNSIHGIQGKLAYDETAIESISFEGMNNWSVTYNSEDNNEYKGTFVLVNLTESVTTEQNIAKIHIKMKQNVSFEDSKINIIDIQTSNGSEKIISEDIGINIQIMEK